MCKAYRIVDWLARYEVTGKGKAATTGTQLSELRVGPLEYIRFKVHGHSHGPGWRKLLRVGWIASDVRELAAIGLFAKLLELAGDQRREFRGWILDSDQRPLTAGGIADELGVHEKTIVGNLMTLLCETMGWVELVEFQENPGIPRDSTTAGGKEGALAGEDGGCLIETERKGKVNTNEIEPGEPGGSILKKDSGGSVSAVKQVTALKLAEIFVSANKSDRTTTVDIINQVDPSKYPLLLEKARQCPGSNNPMAMFVAIAKKEPFNYRPVKRDRLIKGAR